MPTPAQSIVGAISAYNKAAKEQAIGIQPRDQVSGGDFSDLVKNAIEEAVRIGERGEHLSIAAVNGGADLSEVVTAVAEAEGALRTVVAVRDKVIEAYREIIRMPM